MSELRRSWLRQPLSDTQKAIKRLLAEHQAMSEKNSERNWKGAVPK
jgi:hypothetical protein